MAAVASSSRIAPQREGATVFPGDRIGDVGEFASIGVLLGAGVLREGEQLSATRIGIVRWDEPRRTISVQSAHKRYIPAVGDHVIGVVTDRHADEYRLDIGAAAQATLPTLAFDGATKRNRPNLQVGMLVYARLVVANKDMEPEATCQAPPGIAAKDWVTREALFGELVAGTLFECPLSLCSYLEAEDCPVLQALGDLAPFEIAVGANGRIWLHAERPSTVVVAQQAILMSCTMAASEHRQLVEQLAANMDFD
eukprot:CAMPEP_0183345248 /NCGR_PEP_ID=MMETSP0164_2-20130417/10741_1 /TAXON_ID=221442 /ORGANISM="Coccolithus pelagicus ssp braarudi, Strain PLY182g" /LENGTH=252 /DNA_ID=CAMNT_0025516375 /DNA_START=18 /DNA_END=776 /DNA_ORIENTATION=-